MRTTRRELIKGMAATSMLTATSGVAWGQDRVFVPFSNKSLAFYFFVTQQKAVKKAVLDNGWDFAATNAKFETSRQLRQWRTLLLKDPSAIVSDVIDSKAIVSQIRRYNQRGVPVAIIDTPAAGGDVAITVSFDNYQGGVMAAREIVERLKKKYGTAKGVVLNCYGALESIAWRLRKEGFDAEMAKYPDIELLDRPTQGLLKNMLSVTLSTLSEYPDLDAVHSPSDTPSRGIATALKKKGRWKTRNEDGHVIFVNIDGEPLGIHWIEQGYMDADISQDPIAYGQIAVEMLKKYSFKGKDVPLGSYENQDYYWEKGEIVKSSTGPALVIPPFVVDKHNVNDPRLWGNIAWNEWGLRYD